MGAEADAVERRDWFTVLADGELAPGAFRLVDVAGVPVVIWNVGGALHATENACPHQGGPLSEGHLDGAVASCPWHGWQFDVTTGAHRFRPDEHLRVYPVRVRDGRVEVEI